MAMLDWLKRKLPPPGASKGAAAPPASTAASDESPPTGTDRALRCTACKTRGNEFLAKGRLDEAAAAYREAIAIEAGYAEGHLNLGFVLREQKRYDEAEQCLQQAVRLDPTLADAPYVLGTMLEEQGRLDEATACFEQALALNPDFAVASRDLCRVLFNNGKTGRAKEAILAGLARNPQMADFHYYLGNLYADEGVYDQAAASYATALSIAPDYAEVHRNLGKTIQMQGDLEGAIACYQKAISINAASVEARNDLGVAYKERGELEQAATQLRAALDIDPDFAIAANNLAAVRQAQGNLDDAIAWYRRALAIDPGYAGAQCNLGTVFMEQGRMAEAAACLQRALVLDPRAATAHSNLGIVFKEQGRLAEAEACMATALRLDPNHVKAHQNLAIILHAQGRLGEVLACYRRAMELAPEDGGIRMYYVHQAQNECAWNDLEAHGQEVRKDVREGLVTAENPISPFSFLALSGSTSAEQKLCAERWAQSRSRFARSIRETLGFEFPQRSGRPLHVGYLSMDFREHAVAHLMAEVFELHDRRFVRTTAYSYGPNDGSTMRRRLERAFDRFVDIGADSDDAAATKIHADAVDILVDLTGYTANSRSAILAFRPAPIQVNYLGYPGTLGADYVDYLIADRFVIPPQQQDCYTEKIVRLPDCYLPNDRSQPRPPAPSRTDCGLPARGIVFCCFNQTYKITPDVFDIWCRLLNAVPDSTLWLKASNEIAGTNLRREAQQRGVARNRLVMAPQVARTEDHLARLQCADLFLDTVPYNAHTTCRDALWMGLPVVTCVGETFPSRVAGSLLTALEIPELIADDLDDYYALALALATDAPKRAAIRDRIIANRDRAPAFDSGRFTRNLEAAYSGMWDEYARRPHPVRA